MSLPPPSLDPVPAETARIAHAAFPKGTLALVLRDMLGTLYHDGMFADLFPPEGQPALAPWRLALITILQYAENLSDQQAADAVRGRIDWKYALALPLEDAGFHSSVLSTFRDRLVVGQAEERLLWALLEACQARKLLRKRGRQRTDSTQVLAAVRSLNRLELTGETLRAALEALAVAAPDWLLQQVLPDWVERYGRRVEEYRLPDGEAKRRALAEQIGRDGAGLLRALQGEGAPTWLPDLPAVQCLRRVWEQQYDQRGRTLRLRSTDELPPASELIASPYDEDARWGQKRQVGWVGFKVHLTESCDADLPHLITQVATTPAPLSDQLLTGEIWADLAARDLLPADHLVDTGYVDAPGLVAATEQGIRLLGPVQEESSRQARAGEGYDRAHFHLDWEAERATCPAGNESASWRAVTTGRGTQAIQVHFRQADCQACLVRAQCTRASRRSLTLLPHAQHEARQAALERQPTAAFREQYRQRAGIEGTISQAVRRTGLRRARYRGLPKVHLQHCAEATAINVVRLADWFTGTPRAHTRQSHFTCLLAQAA
jgi:transposase